ETFLNMSQLRRENGVWWLGIGANRRSDEDENALAVNVENEEVNNEENPVEDVEEQNEEEAIQEEFDWVQVKEENQVQREPIEKEAEICHSGLGEKFYDAEDVEGPADEEVTTPIMDVPTPEVPAAPVDQSVQSKGKR
ncbi:hypothetical protein Dimus_010312, partial [Dionaea muscipula]